MDSTAALVAIAGTIVTFATPLFLVAIILFYKHRRSRMTHETITRLVEKGLPVPPELLDPPRSRYAGLKGGMVLVAVGIALAIFMGEIGSPWSIGLIPGLMGIALILGWWIERRSQR